MLKKIAIIFGVIMVAIGILGFIAPLSPKGFLLGIFHINHEHNWIHILTGVAAIICGVKGGEAARCFFKVFGVIYALVALLGFVYGHEPIFGVIANNFADSVLHTIIAAGALYLGFGSCSHCCKSECHLENKNEK